MCIRDSGRIVGDDKLNVHSKLTTQCGQYFSLYARIYKEIDVLTTIDHLRRHYADENRKKY